MLCQGASQEWYISPKLRNKDLGRDLEGIAANFGFYSFSID
jgi:hypothetical protein